MHAQSPTSPSELLASARGGQPDCRARLLEQYYNYLKLLAATRLDDKLRARCSPSDVVQETCFEAHRDFDQFRGATEAEFLAWLRQILVNNLARAVEKHVLSKKRDVRREISLERIGAAVQRSTERLAGVLVARQASPSSDAGRREYAVILADRLAELAPDHRQVLVLRHLEGLSFNEVAEQMERSAGAVRMLWLRAMEKLREKLDARGLL